MYIFSSHILETHPEFQFPSDNNWHNLSKKKKRIALELQLHCKQMASIRNKNLTYI